MNLNTPKGNMYPWAYTINPLRGRCPHECGYCYVERLRQRGVKKYNEELSLDESFFKVDLTVPDGYIVFVQSCGDLFAYGVQDSWIESILRYLKKFSRTTFLLQSKNPERFFDFIIPHNCLLGTTLETNREYVLTKAPSVKERYYAMRMLNADEYSLMVSDEPIMDFDIDIFLQWHKDLQPKFVSIGADSGNHKLAEPNREKLATFLSLLSSFTEVRCKKNLSRLLEANQP